MTDPLYDHRKGDVKWTEYGDEVVLTKSQFTALTARSSSFCRHFRLVSFYGRQVSKVADTSIDRLQARIVLLEGLLQQVAHNATGIYVRKDLQAEIRKALGMEEE